MNATSKQTRRANLATRNPVTASSGPVAGDFRRLNFESLEERLYLAVDTIGAADATSLTELAADPLIISQQTSHPHLGGIPAVTFSRAVGKIEIPLSAVDVADKSLVFVAEIAAGDNGPFDFEVQTIDSHHGVLTITPQSAFAGTIFMRVGIRDADQPETSTWLDSREFSQSISDEEQIVDFTLTATKLDGSPLTNLRAGDDFILHVWAQDVRFDAKGIFAAYLNISWNSALATTTGDIQHGERFFNGKSGDQSQSGVIKEAGGFGGAAPTGGKRFDVISVPMRATAAGELSLMGSPSTYLPAHAILAYGMDNGIDASLAKFGQLHLTIAERANADTPGDDGGDAPLTSDAPVDPVKQTVPSNAIVGLELTVTAPDGTPLANPRVGDDFVLHVWVKDLRPNPQGVFAAYLNIDWASELAVSTGDIQHAARFLSGQSGDLSQKGAIREAGGFGGISRTFGGRFEVFSVPMRATATGNLSLVASPAQSSPAHDMLVYGVDDDISPLNVQYGQLSFTIGEGVSSTSNGQISAPASPVISVPLIAKVPIFVASSDDSDGNPVTVIVSEWLSPEFQAALANRLADISTIQNADSRAALLCTTTSEDATDQSPFPTTNRQAELAIVSHKPSTEAADNAVADSAATAKTELSLL